MRGRCSTTARLSSRIGSGTKHTDHRVLCVIRDWNAGRGAASSEDFVEALVPLPMEVVYVLTMGVAVRLVASGIKLSNEELETLVGATWRAITKAT